jgi:hypothetical protein
LKKTNKHPYNAGDVWDYPYLWARQSKDGETSGRKNRPCAMAFLIKRSDGLEHVLLLAITSKKPHKNTNAIEIPDIEKHRANLDHSLRLWIILNERNEDIPKQSYYFEAGGYVASFSQSFTKQVQKAKIATIKARQSTPVSRLD